MTSWMISGNASHRLSAESSAIVSANKNDAQVAGHPTGSTSNEPMDIESNDLQGVRDAMRTALLGSRRIILIRG